MIPANASDWANYIAPLWLLVGWIGYAQFAKKRAKESSHSLSSILHHYRIDWMKRVLAREQRISDASLISNLEKNVNFFASTSLLVLAGLVTALSAADQTFTAFEALPFAHVVSANAFKFMLLLLCFIFIYAFFTFTWSLRQYNFCSTLLGAAPMPEDKGVSPQQREVYAFYTAKIMDQAAHSYNYGLRSYYFALSVLAWFVSPWLFMAAVVTVITILYRREFCSKPLAALQNILGSSSSTSHDKQIP